MAIIRDIQRWPACFYKEGKKGHPKIIFTDNRAKVSILKKGIGDCTLYRIVWDKDLPPICFQSKSTRISRKRTLIQ